MEMKEGVLLLQLGSPKAYTTEAVKEYLLSFLGDPHTLGSPPFFWNPLLRYIIAPSRAKRSALKYKEMCEIQGVTEMPLITHTRNFVQGVQAKLKDRAFVRYAFQYGASPSIQEALDDFVKEGVKKVRVIPLYPQRSGATSVSALDQLKENRAKYPSLDFYACHGFADHPAWIENVVQTIKTYDKDSSYTILISWHGMPQKRIRLGDPYESDCQKSVLAIEQKLGRSVLVSYQSRFGVGKWLGPSTNDTLTELGKAGAKVIVVCPAFTVDNLETFHEIDIEAKKIFLNAGGQDWQRVPCLNASPKWITDFANHIALDLPCQEL
ncbi:MAG: ferrochelatase [Fibrobacter sp.]|nr:ferrochelatase [Fibrobacter sp.]